MADTEFAILARGWAFTAASAPVGGVNKFTVAMSDEKADTTRFRYDGAAGWKEHLVALRGMTITLDGIYLEDGAGARDAGQAVLDNASLLFGIAGQVAITATSPGGHETSFLASVKRQDIGGGNADPTSWGAELTVTGLPVV
jgi:hypothetical protein